VSAFQELLAYGPVWVEPGAVVVVRVCGELALTDDQTVEMLSAEYGIS
jgi:hypothetical protein